MSNAISDWRDGLVDPAKEHLRVWTADREVARVAPEGDHLAVEFVTSDSVGSDDRAAVSRVLDYYVRELGEPDPWRYLVYHCRTASNLYAEVRFEHRIGDRDA